MVRFAGSALPFPGFLLHGTHLFAIAVAFLTTVAKHPTRSNLKEKQMVCFDLLFGGPGHQSREAVQ